MELEKYGLVPDLVRWSEGFFKSKVAKGVKESTLESYKAIILEFIGYCEAYENEMNLSEINKLLFDNWINRLRIKGKSDKSIELYIIVVKMFLRFISEVNSDLVDYSRLLRSITKVSGSKKEIESLDEKEYKRVEIYINNIELDSFFNIRNALMVKILLYTGVRVSELLSLKLNSFYYMEERDVYKITLITLKKRKEESRTLFIATSSIGEELIRYKKYLKSENSYLFTTEKGRVLTRQEIYNTLTLLFKRAGVQKRGVHIFRHTLAKKLVRDGANLSVIKSILGHSNINTTVEFYAKADERAIEGVMVGRGKKGV